MNLVHNVVLRPERDVLWSDLEQQDVATETEEHERIAGEEKTLGGGRLPANSVQLQH